VLALETRLERCKFFGLLRTFFVVLLERMWHSFLFDRGGCWDRGRTISFLDVFFTDAPLVRLHSLQLIEPSSKTVEIFVYLLICAVVMERAGHVVQSLFDNGQQVI
jgi:hypothetical protein